MALKAVHVSDVSGLDHVPAALSLCCSSSPSTSTSTFPRGVEAGRAVMTTSKAAKFMVIGHRGRGMNLLNSPDRRMRSFMENTILSFNSAAKHPLDFIEFDVQGSVFEKRVAELSLPEFCRTDCSASRGKLGSPC